MSFQLTTIDFNLRKQFSIWKPWMLFFIAFIEYLHQYTEAAQIFYFDIQQKIKMRVEFIIM